MPRIQKEMLACLQCGYCIEVCETHNQTPWESVTPRGKIYYLTQVEKKNPVDRLLGRKVELSPEFVNAMFSCTGCGSCEAVCHGNIELVEFWEKVREWLVEEGVAPLPAHAKLAERIATGRNPYGEDPNDRDAWWPEGVERVEYPDTIFFAGCTGSYRMQDIAKAGVEVLNRAGVKMNCLGADEWCCTSPALRTGQTKMTKEAATSVVDKADAMGAKNMVMTCAGCFKTVSTDFGNHYARATQDVMHFTEYAEKLINEKKLVLKNEFNAKVTYHDPCHLGRHAGVFDAPRNILGKIKGLEFVEMERNRKNSRCCGAGGGYKSAFNDLAVNVAAERVRDAEDVGAEIIVTACPFCVLNLKQGAKQAKSNVKVMDISQLLLQVTEPTETN
ncbi:MAG: (Fe-S)-binding protein [Candidatus Methanomethylophilaceae archaeon]